jgi:hypothetical protein
MNDYTEMIRVIGDLKNTALYTIGTVVVIYLASMLIRSWWNYKEKLNQQKEKDEAIKREEARELRLGARLDDINNRVIGIFETTITTNTQALEGVKQAIQSCTRE